MLQPLFLLFLLLPLLLLRLLPLRFFFCVLRLLFLFPLSGSIPRFLQRIWTWTRIQIRIQIHRKWKLGHIPIFALSLSPLLSACLFIGFIYLYSIFYMKSRKKLEEQVLRVVTVSLEPKSRVEFQKVILSKVVRLLSLLQSKYIYIHERFKVTARVDPS